ncbi:hypothetical protein BH11BAC3_BH11BAC3_34330 [soil metagenome]
MLVRYDMVSANFFCGKKELLRMSFVLFCVILLCCNYNNVDVPVSTKSSVNTDNILSIKKAIPLLRNGDLVTRSDDDFESLSLQNFSTKDRTYSHSGLAFLEGGSFYVYHSMAGTENPDGHFRREPFDSFVSPAKKTGFGIFRYQLSLNEIEALHTLYKKYYEEKTPFDKSFNLISDDSMYCSEIIYKSLKRVTNNRIILPVSVLTNFKPKLPGLLTKNIHIKRFEYIGLDDLYMNSFCKAVVQIHYQ